MGILFQTSFDHYTSLLPRWNALNNVTPGIGAVGRNSTSGVTLAGGAARSITKTLSSTPSTIYYAFAFKTNTLSGTPIAQMLDNGAIQMQLALRNDGKLQFFNSASAGIGVPSAIALSADTFYHIEMKIVIHNSAGSIELRVNENIEIGPTGSLDTQNTENAYITQINLTTNTGSSHNLIFDDVVVRDDNWSGDVQVKAFLPTGTGATDQWSPSGAASTREAVDEATPNSDTDFAAAGTVSYLSLWTYDSIPTTSTIDAVIPLPFVKKTDAGTAKFKSIVRYASNNYPGVEKAPSDSSYEYHPDVLMTNPGTGVSWTALGWNSPIEIGVERTA